MTTDSTDTSDWAWEGLPPPLRDSLESGWRNGVPPTATALFVRWWQLETWLRSLAYVELRAQYGVKWGSQIPTQAQRLVEKAGRLHHMATPDATATLAYLDTGLLFQLLEANWELFSTSLLDLDVWRGRVVELADIRRRIAHCRRPHSDDLDRLEQSLRDLERGAFRALSRFNTQSLAENDREDPVARGWVAGRHDDAIRLIKHADRQYDVGFSLRHSRRPWAPKRDKSPVSGNPGYLWHAHWILRQGSLDLEGFWRDSYLNDARDSIVFVCAPAPYTIEISFPAVDDGVSIADAIGASFDTILTNMNRHREPPDFDRYRRMTADLDPRIQVDSAWCVIDETTQPVTIFGATK